MGDLTPVYQNYGFVIFNPSSRKFELVKEDIQATDVYPILTVDVEVNTVIVVKFNSFPYDIRRIAALKGLVLGIIATINKDFSGIKCWVSSENTTNYVIDFPTSVRKCTEWEGEVDGDIQELLGFINSVFASI